VVHSAKVINELMSASHFIGGDYTRASYGPRVALSIRVSKEYKYWRLVQSVMPCVWSSSQNHSICELRLVQKTRDIIPDFTIRPAMEKAKVQFPFPITQQQKVANVKSASGV